MANSGRFMRTRAPRQRSFFLSFLFFFCLLGLFILIANVTNGGLQKSWNELFEEEEQVRSVVRQNKNQLSLERFEDQLPNQLLAIGLCTSGEGSFYHEFINLSKKYKKVKRIQFALANIDVYADQKMVDDLISKKRMLAIDKDNLPMVVFFYKGAEISNERLSLKYSNLIQSACHKRIKKIFKSKLIKKTK